MKFIRLLEELVEEQKRANDIAERQLAAFSPMVRIPPETWPASVRRTLSGRGATTSP